MKKGYLKEVFILILLLILIMLILAVSLYDFIPSNISVPESVSYSSDTITTSIKQEIAYTNGGDTTSSQTDSELVTSLKSYSVDASDLTMYGQKNLYNSGNSNPFDYAQETNPSTSTTTEGQTNTNNTTPQTNGTTQNTSTTSNGSTTTTTQTNTNGTNSNTGTFFESSTSK